MGLHPQLIGEDVEELWECHRIGLRRRQEETKQFHPRNCRTIQKFLDGRNGRLPVTPEVSAILDAFHISPKYHDVLTLHIHVAGIPLLAALDDHHGRNHDGRMKAYMLSITWERYKKFLSPTSELVETGLFSKNRSGDYYTTDMFDDILQSLCKTPQAVKRVVLGKPQKASLTPQHFEHLQEEYD